MAGRLLVAVFIPVLTCGADWAQFRGQGGNPVAENSILPTGLDDGTVQWKVALPAKGPSSPIVVGDQVIVTCGGGPRQQRIYVVSFDTATGEKNWQREFWATGRPYTHPFSGNAAPTPASDGASIYAFFSSNDLICLDADGNLEWYRGLGFDYPRAVNDAGMSSSPILHGDLVIVQIDNQGDSFAAGIDRRTGETRWRISRDPVASWSSPVLAPPHGGAPAMLLLQSPQRLTAHDPDTGRELWSHRTECDGIVSPVALEGRVYVATNGLSLLDIESRSAPGIVWESSNLRPAYASPVVYDGRVYTVNFVGVLCCGDARTGERLWQLRLGGKHWATPVIANGHAYCFNDQGDARVVALKGKGEIVGEGKLGEAILGTPAVSGSAMYVRSDQFLWKIAAPH